MSKHRLPVINRLGRLGLRGPSRRLSVCAPYARDFIDRRATTPELRATDRWKSIRARVEHPIEVIKRVFGFTKARYRGCARIAIGS